MNPQQQLASTPSVTSYAVHLMLREGDSRMIAEDPERLMEEIRSRATQIGSVLEGILHEPHGEPRWGLNE